MGSRCGDLTAFMHYSVFKKPLESYLINAEDQAHGNIHFAFGGSGGDHCVATDKTLMLTYNFNENDLVAIGQSAQKFFKSYSHSSSQDSFLTCSNDPWQGGKLTTTTAPGEDGGPTCTCNSYYFETEERFQQLVSAFFVNFQGNFVINAVSYLQNTENDFNDRKAAMNLICGRFQYDGDMAGSSAATDPLFWVAHGSLERLYQKLVFENYLSDSEYVDAHESCSGHMALGTKQWLEGYLFADETIAAETLSNKDLLSILDPSTESFRDKSNFVYDHSSWTTVCQGAFFSQKKSH
jgi:hypothetical protein